MRGQPARALGAEFPGFVADGWPSFDRARGSTVIDVDGRELLDLSMLFGCAIFGHSATQEDAARLMTPDAGWTAGPGVGDLAGHTLRSRATQALAEEASRAWGGRELSVLIHHTGSEAVETALKTALGATGRSRVVAFEGAYHGTFGLPLALTWRAEFRKPYLATNHPQVAFARWGEVPALDESVAAVVVEPVQGRAGLRFPPDGYLEGLRRACDGVGALLVIDAVYVGAGRAGSFLGAAGGCDPDIVAMGKALAGGLPGSCAIARAEVADAAWGTTGGEVPHTSTHLASPVACAAILAAAGRRTADWYSNIADASAKLETGLAGAVEGTSATLRGLGLMWAIDTHKAGGGVELSNSLREDGILAVPAAADGSVLALTPASCLADEEVARLCAAIGAGLSGSWS